MKKTYLLFILCFLAGLLSAHEAGAHEPRYVQDSQLVIIKNPNISQAFYGELKGREAYYLIDLKQEQDLFFQILVPNLPDIQKDKSISIDYSPKLGQKAISFLNLNPELAVWKNFYDDYAGDDYWQGPDIKKTGESGYYFIKVASPDNTGKYVLVVGEKEEFPAPEIIKAAIIIPMLKTQFFSKPIWQAFQGKIGLYLGIGLLIVLVFGYMFRKFHQVYK
jgi:hypothetical protein